MSATPPDEPPQNIATAVAEVSDRATQLVREEIELAKAEVTEKVTTLARGTAIGVAAGVFAFAALWMALIGCAWLLYYYLPGNAFTYFWGFFAMALILLGLGVGAGLLAARAFKRGAPPTPDMALEEARRIRETVSAEAPPVAPGSGGSAPAVAPGGGSAPASAPPGSESSDGGR